MMDSIHMLADEQCGTLYRVNDIATALVVKNIRSAIRFYNTDERVSRRCLAQGFVRLASFFTQKGLIRYLVSSRRIDAAILAGKLGIEITNIKVETLESQAPLKTVFCQEEMIEQYVVKAKHPGVSYRIDLYMPIWRIAVECDEKLHQSHTESDKERQAWIEKVLKCRFKRFRPHRSDFSILNVISEIHYLMNKRTFVE
jgi:very-short-patch-repair endonuclease